MCRFIIKNYIINKKINDKINNVILQVVNTMDKKDFREQIKYDKDNNAEGVIEEVALKFGYSQELKDLLLKIYNRVYSNSSYEVQQNFLQTLNEVPIVVVDKMTPELYGELQDEYLGKDRVQIEEEAINTVLEYENVAKFLGIEPQEVDDELYRGVGIHGLVPSSYHGLMDSIGQKIQMVLGKSSLEQIRLFDNKKAIEEFNQRGAQTQYWQERAHSEEEMKKKKEILEAPESTSWKEFCQKNYDTYFGIHDGETPIQRIDNVLRQVYDMKMVKYNIPLEEYNKIILNILGEAYYVLNQMEAERESNLEKQKE